jgi:PAS domain S-box-containing protein
LKILVVDDKEESRYLLSALLTGHGHVVEAATNGEEALTKLRSDAFGLVISDILMPVMDGFRLCREVRKDERLRGVLFVFYTATYVQESDETFALQLGADDFILKPAEPEAFLARIQTVVDRANGKGWTPRSPEPTDEADVLRLYSERLVAKLEKRTVDLDRELAARRRAEEALRESEEKFRHLFEVSPSGIALIDAQGVLREANPTLLRLLDISKEDLVGRPFAELLPRFGLEPEDQYADFTRRLTGEAAMRELTFRNRDGTQTTIDIRSSVVVSDGQAAGVMYLIDDITERKQAEVALSRSLEATLSALGRAAERRDPYTAGHQRRVTDLAVAIARELGCSDGERNTLRIAGMLHDVGKLGIPAEILSKPSALNPIEFELVRTHPQAAYEILADVAFPGPVAEIVLQHHERLDGSGYPRRIGGDDILIGARILAVADVVEAMASHRPYRPALGIDAALKEIRAGRGTRYDQQAVDACAALFESGEFSFSPTSER